MLFSRKENIFMCLVTFQKIFWKIFSGVWRRRRKRQTRQTQKKDGAIAPRSSRSGSTVRSHRSSIVAAVDRDLSQRVATIDDRDPRAHSLDDRIARRSHRWSFDERARRMIALLVDRCSLIWALSSLSLSLSPRSGLSLLSLSLSLSLFPKMNWSKNEGVNSFSGQRRKFWSIGRWFPENFIFRCNQTCGFGWKWFQEQTHP